MPGIKVLYHNEYAVWDLPNVTFNVTGFSSYKILNESNLTTVPVYSMKDRNTTFLVNPSPDGIMSINFTVISPAGSKVLNNVNGSVVGNFWNVTYNLTSYGTWLWNVSIFFDNGIITNSSTQTIILMQITSSLNVSSTTPSKSISVFGRINLSNGTNATGIPLTVFINGVNVTNATTDSYGNYSAAFMANSTTGTYTVKVNTTFLSIPGESTASIVVYNYSPSNCSMLNV